MMKVYDIILELRETNSSKLKQQILEKYKINEVFKKVIELALSSQYNYNLSLKTVNKMQLIRIRSMTTNYINLNDGLDKLLLLTDTKNMSKKEDKENLIKDLYATLSNDDFEIIKLIIDRDLNCGVNIKTAQKVFGKVLLYTPPYMRCSTYSAKTLKNIKFSPSACIQLKADGSFRSVVKSGDTVTFITRSGEISRYEYLEEIFSNFADGVYIGEMLVKDIVNRSEANGLLNSLTPPQDKIYMQLWDFITLDEWKEGKSRTKYIDRFETLKELVGVNDAIQIIPTFEVFSLKEALQKTSEFMTNGFEGAILKDWSNTFNNHTSPTQLKLKICIDTSVRVVGFTEGTEGTKREDYFGAIIYETDDGKVKGRASGFTEAQMIDFNNRRDEIIGSIIDVQFNDITKARNNEHYALSHPRFICIRDDISQTDTIERIFELRDMAINLS